MTESQLKGRLSTRLKKECKPTSLSEYYYDKKARREAIISIS
jgi:hypothetical protein